jgi:hypothetical protein
VDAESDSPEPDATGEPDLLRQPEQRPRRRAVLAVLAAVTVVLGGISLGLNHLARSTPTSPGKSSRAQVGSGAGIRPEGRMYACAMVITGRHPAQPGPPDDSCLRQARDHERRAELSPADQREVIAALPDVEAAIRRLLAPLPCQPARPCSGVLLPSAAPRPGAPPNGGAAAGAPRALPQRPPMPTAATADQVRRALLNARYADVTVRLARPDDPAPPGSLLWSVRIGPGCLIGVDGPWSNGVRAESALPGGHCLDP